MTSVPTEKGEPMRLIDADALKTRKSINSANFNTIETIQEWIDNAPTIDAVPVVRCGECKYYFPYKHYDGRILGYHCQAPNQQTDFLEPTHYCGFGERKADDHI